MQPGCQGANECLDCTSNHCQTCCCCFCYLTGVTPNQFNSSYRAGVLNVLSQVSGTPVDGLQMQVVPAQLQQQAPTFSSSSSSGGGRKLLQQQQPLLYVSASILTSNPVLIVYRLSQQAAANTAGSSPTGQAFTGCTTELCSRLIAAGVPVDPSSIQISPSYAALAGSGSSSPAAAAAAASAAAAAQLVYTRQLAIIITSSIGGFMVLLVLALNSRRIIDCFARSACFQAPVAEQLAVLDVHDQQQQQQQLLIGAGKKGTHATGSTTTTTSSNTSSSDIPAIIDSSTIEGPTEGLAAATTAAASNLIGWVPDAGRAYQPFEEYQENNDSAYNAHPHVSNFGNPADAYPAVSYVTEKQDE